MTREFLLSFYHMLKVDQFVTSVTDLQFNTGRSAWYTTVPEHYHCSQSLVH
jgi:hypothetical protein